MSPAIDSDTRYVARGIETSVSEHTSQLIADITLKSWIRRTQQLCAARPMLLSLGEAGFTGRSEHEQNHRFRRVASKLVVAEADREIQGGVRVVASGGHDGVHPKFVEGRPVADGCVSVDQGRFHQIRE